MLRQWLDTWQPEVITWTNVEFSFGKFTWYSPESNFTASYQVIIWHNNIDVCTFSATCHFSLGARRDIMASNKNEQCLDCILTRKVLSKVQKSCRQECALFVWIRVYWWHLPELQYLAIQWSGNNTRDTTCSSLKMNGPRLDLVPSSEGSAYNKSIQSIFQQCDIDIHFMYKLEIYCSPWQLSLISTGWYQNAVRWCVASNVKNSWHPSPELNLFRHMHLKLRLTPRIKAWIGSYTSEDISYF